MNGYRHPMSYRPVLAHGGHTWQATGRGRYATCRGCYSTVPWWALREGFWRTLAAPWCPGRIRALAAGSVDRESTVSTAHKPRFTGNTPSSPSSYPQAAAVWVSL